MIGLAIMEDVELIILQKAMHSACLTVYIYVIVFLIVLTSFLYSIPNRPRVTLVRKEINLLPF